MTRPLSRRRRARTPTLLRLSASDADDFSVRASDASRRHGRDAIYLRASNFISRHRQAL